MITVTYWRRSLHTIKIWKIFKKWCVFETHVTFNFPCFVAGRHSCEMPIPDPDLDELQPCLEDLKSYLETSFKCIPGLFLSFYVCDTACNTFNKKSFNGQGNSMVTVLHKKFLVQWSNFHDFADNAVTVFSWVNQEIYCDRNIMKIPSLDKEFLCSTVT